MLRGIHIPKLQKVPKANTVRSRRLTLPMMLPMSRLMGFVGGHGPESGQREELMTALGAVKVWLCSSPGNREMQMRVCSSPGNREMQT